MISASRCRLPSNGAGAWARAGMAAASRLTRAAMIKRRAIGFRLRGNRAVAGAAQGKMSDHKPTETWPQTEVIRACPSVDGRQSLESCSHDGSKSGCCWQRRNFVLCNPAPLAQLFIELRLTCDPARRKRQNHEMAL